MPAAHCRLLLLGILLALLATPAAWAMHFVGGELDLQHQTGSSYRLTLYFDMASTPQFVDFVVEQLNASGHVSPKKMFGEYGLYWDDKLFALVCDNKLYVKPTAAGRTFWPEAVEAAPYPGAKPSFPVEEQLEDRGWLATLARLTVEELPDPKPKPPKRRAGR